MAVDLENMHDAFPDYRIAMPFRDGHRLNERRRTPVLRLDGALQLGGSNLDHEKRQIDLAKVARCAIP